jgi:GPH family glycoside/pentoside/hexuronide:cation symporter
LSSKSHSNRLRLPLSRTLAFGVGNMANQIFDSGIQYIVLQVFAISLGVNPFLVGLAQSIARGVDLFTDPLAGYLSDSLRHRIGLRAYAIAGSIVGGIAFAFIWLFPPGLSSTGYFLWLLVGFSVTAASWSFFSVPRGALGIEMTTEPYERAKLMTISGFMAIACNFCLCWSYAATQLPFFRGTVDGARWVGGAMGVGIIAFGLTSALLSGGGKPLPRSVAPAGERREHPGFGDFWLAVRRVARCRPFVLLAGSFAIIQVGLIGADMGLLPYIIIYHVCGGNQAQGAIILGAAATAWLSAALLVSAPVLWISQRIGKKETLLLFLGLTLAGSCARWLFYNPALPYLVVIPFALYGCGTGAFFLLAPSMTADASDLEESISGVRDTGMFSALFSWVNKLGTTIGTLATGLLITLTGFTAGLEGGLPRQALINMKVFDTVIPSIGIAVGMMMILRYPLTARRMESVRAILLGRQATGGLSPINGDHTVVRLGA